MAVFLCLAAAAAAADGIEALIEELRSGNEEVRTRAAAEIEGKGADAVEPLKKAIEAEKDEAVKARLAALLEKVDWPEGGNVHDELRLTLKVKRARVARGEDIAAAIRLTSTAKAPRRIEIDTENPPGAGRTELERSLRLVAIDAQGHHRALGTFQNFNRGPDRLDVKVAPGDEVAEIGVRAGILLEKGRHDEVLPPGDYKVYAILGDTLGSWSSVHPPPLRSNEVAIRITEPKEK